MALTALPLRALFLLAVLSRWKENSVPTQHKRSGPRSLPPQLLLQPPLAGQGPAGGTSRAWERHGDRVPGCFFIPFSSPKGETDTRRGQGQAPRTGGCGTGWGVFFLLFICWCSPVLVIVTLSSFNWRKQKTDTGRSFMFSARVVAGVRSSPSALALTLVLHQALWP